jgi:hypothetical protein
MCQGYLPRLGNSASANKCDIGNFDFCGSSLTTLFFYESPNLYYLFPYYLHDINSALHGADVNAG